EPAEPPPPPAQAIEVSALLSRQLPTPNAQVLPALRTEPDDLDDDETRPRFGSRVSSLYSRMCELDPGTLLSFFFGTVALLLASIPDVSFLTKPLSGLGLFIG